MSCNGMNRINSADIVQRKQSAILINLLFCLTVLGVFVLFFGRLTFISSGKAIGEIKGFDVDKEEKLYIGTSSKIVVVENGRIVDSITPPTTRAYCFYIENNMLYIGCANGGIYDLNRKEFSYKDLSISDVKGKAKGNTVQINGHEFIIHNKLFDPLYVSKDGVIIYQSQRSFFDSLLYWCCFAISSLLFVFFILLKVSDSQQI